MHTLCPNYVIRSCLNQKTLLSKVVKIYPDYAKSKGFPDISTTWLMSNFSSPFCIFKVFYSIFHHNHEAFKFCYSRSCSNQSTLLSKSVSICTDYSQLKGFPDISTTGLINNFLAPFLP